MRIKRFQVLALISFMTLLIIVCIILIRKLYNNHQSTLKSQRATMETIALLTDKHGEETCRIIENFESKWNSLETYQDPNIRLEIATEHYLRYPGIRNTSLSETSTLHVTTSANVINTHVLEYSADRIVAVADVIKIWENITVQGETVSEESTQHNCKIYLFYRQEGCWKLHELFFMSHEEFDRYWEDNAAYLEPLFGPKPDKYLCQWWEGRPCW